MITTKQMKYIYARIGAVERVTNGLKDEEREVLIDRILADSKNNW